MDISKTLESVQKEIDDVQQWADEQYDLYFAKYFKGEVELYNKFQDKNHVVGDDELEWVLTALPLELFSVTEQLNKLKTAQEVIKLHIKETEMKYINDPSRSDESMTKRKEDAATLTMADKLLVSIYNTIIERVERQMTFSKELIMSSKKIFDARRVDGNYIPSQDMQDYDYPKH